MYIKGRDLRCTANPVSNKPEQKHRQLISDDLWIFFSTILPPKAALMPRKNIARENANCTLD